MNLKEILKKIKLSEKAISAVLGGAVIVVIGVLLFNFFQSKGVKKQLIGTNGEVEKEMTTEEKQLTKLPLVHKVVKGENLWVIAEQYYNSGYNWIDIVVENSLRQPDLLLVGQELIIPSVSVREPGQLLDKAEKKESRINAYTVQKSDSLWNIAVAVYGDGYQWTKIYEANKAQIGVNPGLIYAETILTIPS